MRFSLFPWNSKPPNLSASSPTCQDLEHEAQLVAVILHELRNPLFAIALSAELLEEDVAPVQKQKCLDRIQTKVKQMTHLLDNLTVLVAEKDEDFQLNLECKDLKCLCTELIEEFSFLTDIHHFTFSSCNQDPTCSQQPWAQAWIDEPLLTRSLANLLFNAIKFSPEGGKITLKLSRQRGWFTLKIQDTGIGIASDELPFVFDWLYRGSCLTNVSGSGLGLAIAKRCIELHGGTISIQSRLNVGTKITIRLPTKNEVPGDS